MRPLSRREAVGFELLVLRSGEKESWSSRLNCLIPLSEAKGNQLLGKRYHNLEIIVNHEN
ncbi:MAG: hypothetical protein AB1306_09025 [Nitrospirota bacterium]